MCNHYYLGSMLVYFFFKQAILRVILVDAGLKVTGVIHRGMPMEFEQLGMFWKGIGGTSLVHLPSKHTALALRMDTDCAVVCLFLSVWMSLTPFSVLSHFAFCMGV